MIRLENIENKELLLKDFFTWLFEDENIVLYHEEDLSLCHDYSDCNIYYPSGIKDFFETSFMQRLNRISQLGLAINVNQNLYNNRLEHSKGVYNRKVEEFFYNYQNPSWKKYIEDNNLKLYIIGDLIKMAGHDIGHLPLSHVFEMYAFNQKGAHEEIGKKIMLQDPEICSILKKIHPNLPKIIDELYNKKLLNFSEHDESIYDVDRIDFLYRDSLYYGYISYLPVQSYETVNIKVDKNGLPLENSDNSIIQDNTSSKSIDVYDYSSLKEIEKTLKLHTTRYHDIYYSHDKSIYESTLNEFLSAFMSCESNCGKDLRQFILSLPNDPNEIDLDTFKKWDEIKFYSEVLDIAEHHENQHMRDLATMIIPHMTAFLNLIYSHLKMYTKSQNYSPNDLDFLLKIKELIKSNSQLLKNIENSSFTSDNTIFLDSNSLKFIDNSLIYLSSAKINSYKPSEPVYVRDKNGKIFELSKHPSRNYNWKNSTIIIPAKFVHIPYLKFMGVTDETIEKLKNSGKIATNRFSHKISNEVPKVNLSPLNSHKKIESNFLEL